MKKIIYIGTVGYAHYVNFISHVCEGTYEKTFDTEKFANIEEARIAKEILFGMYERPKHPKTVVHLNAYLPKAHKTHKPKVAYDCFIACFEEDKDEVLTRLINYRNDPDNAGQVMPDLLISPKKAYQKYHNPSCFAPALDAKKGTCVSPWNELMSQ